MRMQWELALVHHKFLGFESFTGFCKAGCSSQNLPGRRLETLDIQTVSYPYFFHSISFSGFMRPADCPVDQSFRADRHYAANFLGLEACLPSISLKVLSKTAKFNFSIKRSSGYVSEGTFETTKFGVCQGNQSISRLWFNYLGHSDCICRF